eukprot:tig00001001_g6218.t1
MAANFWPSSHCNHWLLDRNRVRLSYARDRDVLHESEIRKLHMHFATLIQAAGKLLKLRQRLIATAMVYFKRFYIKNSLLSYDPRLIAATSLYVASKVEECPLQAKLLCVKVRTVDPAFNYGVADVLECEFFVLEELNFYLIVYHPYRPLTQLLSEGNAPNEVRGLFKMAWTIVNDSYLTDLCLLYPPYMIALAAVFMAGCCDEAHQVKVDPTPWFSELQVDLKTIGEICEELYKLYPEYKRIDAEREIDALKKKLYDSARYQGKPNLGPSDPTPSPCPTPGL